ncbi:hypothetical protein TNCV_4110011 [Trichonephila clavipes]|nr:hypothetical protein TNCV_4110011 [Trichonephila clavipes]
MDFTEINSREKRGKLLGRIDRQNSRFRTTKTTIIKLCLHASFVELESAKSALNECITSVVSVFSSIVRDFLELFYNLWRTVLTKNKIVLDPALRLQSFRTPENATIGVRSGVECQQQERWRPSSRLF